MLLTRITLIRHGQTTWNADGRWQGHAPVPLDKIGRQQAAMAAEYLSGLGIDFIYSSDLRRARETAQIIADRLKLTVGLDVRLRENDLGEWQGLTSDEIKEWDGETYAQVGADPFNIPRPGGESWSQMARRGCQALHDFIKEHPGSHLLVVSHGGTIRAIVEGLKVLSPSDFRVPNTSLTQFHHDESNGGWKLLSVGEIPHLTTQTRETVLSEQHILTQSQD